MTGIGAPRVNAGEALAALAEGPRVITIDSAQRSGWLVLSVRDNGIGVKHAAQLETMFEHFVSTKPHGLGMGLTISRSIVEAHRGLIWAEANPGRGLALRVELPALPAVRASA